LITTGKVFDGITTSNIQVPLDAEELNWAKKKLVAPIKNQGLCGNGYIFGAVAAVESALMVQTPILKVSYSEQQVTDCCTSSIGYSCNGCNGGSLPAVFEYIAKAGVSTSKNYVYASEDGKVRTCHSLTSPDKIANSGSYKRIPPYNLSALHEELSKKPIAVLVDATNWAEYKGGIFNNCSESLSANNHAALLVGYDDKGNWIVKNSWGEKWGEEGLITLSPGNTCGISNYAISFNANSVL
jgi:cathepsin L